MVRYVNVSPIKRIELLNNVLEKRRQAKEHAKTIDELAKIYRKYGSTKVKDFKEKVRSLIFKLVEKISNGEYTEDFLRQKYKKIMQGNSEGLYDEKLEKYFDRVMRMISRRHFYAKLFGLSLGKEKKYSEDFLKKVAHDFIDIAHATSMLLLYKPLEDYKKIEKEKEPLFLDKYFEKLNKLMSGKANYNDVFFELVEFVSNKKYSKERLERIYNQLLEKQEPDEIEYSDLRKYLNITRNLIVNAHNKLKTKINSLHNNGVISDKQYVDYDKESHNILKNNIKLFSLFLGK